MDITTHFPGVKFIEGVPHAIDYKGKPYVKICIGGIRTEGEGGGSLINVHDDTLWEYWLLEFKKYLGTNTVVVVRQWPVIIEDIIFVLDTFNTDEPRLIKQITKCIRGRFTFYNEDNN